MITIPNYIIKKELGKSSMEATYLAENTVLNHNVFLRVIHPDNAKNDAFRHHFLTIGERLIRWEHPHIVKIYDVGITDDNIFYISMEYLEKENLRKKISQKNTSVASVLKITKDVGEALSYIHNQGFIHGNLKPDNIFFNHEGITKLLDNGCTELKSASSDLALQGNLHYMSPEQAAMTKLDQRADIYSLGLIIYEMLVGEKAFYANTTADAISQHTMHSHPDLPDKYSYLQPVLDKALAKSPYDRYTTIEDMLQALEVSVDTFHISQIDNQVEIEHTKTEAFNKGIYVKHQSVYVENQSVYVSHQDKSQKPWLFRGLLAGFLVLLTLLAFLFNHIITIDSFNKKPIISEHTDKNFVTTAAFSSPPNETHVNPVSFIEKNEKIETHDRNKKVNKGSEERLSSGDIGIHDRNKKSAESTLEKKSHIPTSKVLINTFSAKNKETLKANIKITSKETNEVIVDGKNIAPRQFELEVGEYALRVTHKGYVSQSKLLKITDIPHNEVAFNLKEKALLIGRLKVRAVSKKNATALHAIYEVRGINSTYYNKKKKRKSAYFKLPVGKYELSVRYKDKTIKKRITIKKDKTINKKLTFNLSNEKIDKKPTKTKLPKKITTLGYIHISAKLAHEKGRHLPADFFLYHNQKMVKKALGRKSIRFKVPTGKYVIKVMYKGVSSQAKAVVEKGDIIEQTFIYDNIPTLN